MKIIRINAIWCSGCLSMKKVWKKVLEIYPDLNIITYDYDLDKEKIKKYEVGKILPVIIFQKGNIEKRLIGEQTKEKIIEVIEELK